jgi:hypothetical protein
MGEQGQDVIYDQWTNWGENQLKEMIHGWNTLFN